MYVHCIYYVYTCMYYIYTLYMISIDMISIDMPYTCMNNVHTMYVRYIYVYAILIYLYSTACLYSKSSEGVNLFCCSSSIIGRKPPSNAAACDILLPVVVPGTGRLLSKVCSLSKQDCSWHSKPLINLLIASSVSVASGLASKKSPSSGQGLPSSSSSLAEEGRGRSLRTPSLCWPRKPVGTTGM